MAEAGAIAAAGDVPLQLPALSLEETAGYIGTRLAGAGVEGSGLFPQETVEEVFRYSKGVPRVIHLLCEHSLLAAYADRQIRSRAVTFCGWRGSSIWQEMRVCRRRRSGRTHFAG